MNDKTIYTEDSIKSISPREFTRTRPGVYAGSVEYSTQLVREAFANALDEHLIGHGNNIQILVNTESNTYTVQDEAQGFPVNKKRDDGETILSASFSVLNTSGKYDEDGVYGGSVLGLNGIGAKLICYLSSYSDILTTDGSGEYEHVWYKDGLFVKREVTKAPKGVHGTSITWTPDPQFFHNKQINFEETRKLFKEISVLCPSLTISLIVDEKEEIYHSENGLKDLVDEKVKGKELLSNRFYCKKVKGDNLFDICLTYTDGYSEDMTAYVNYGLTDGGVHITNLHSLITRNINKAAREKKLLKEKDENLTGQELTEGLVIVFNLKANGVQYDSQSKTRIVDIDKTLLNETITEDFYQWLIYNEKELKAIVEKALLARKAREAAKKVKDAIRQPKEKGLKAKMQLSNKFIDCSNKNPASRNLLLVEGLSAGSAAIEARNTKTDSIYMLRGRRKFCPNIPNQLIIGVYLL